MSRSIHIREVFLWSFDRDDAGVWSRYAIRGTEVFCSNNLAETAKYAVLARTIEPSRRSALGSGKPIYRTGYWKTPEIRFSRHGSRITNKNKINNQTKGIVLCH